MKQSNYSEKNNIEFLNAYNRLDNYLKSLLQCSDKINLISYFGKILPEKQQSELKTIRLYKNIIESHGVMPNGEKPIVAPSWIKWLQFELKWCKSNQEKVIEKISSLLEKEKDEKRGVEKPIDAYHNYFNSRYKYNKGEKTVVKKDSKVTLKVKLTKCDFCSSSRSDGSCDSYPGGYSCQKANEYFVEYVKKRPKVLLKDYGKKMTKCDFCSSSYSDGSCASYPGSHSCQKARDSYLEALFRHDMSKK